MSTAPARTQQPQKSSGLFGLGPSAGLSPASAGSIFADESRNVFGTNAQSNAANAGTEVVEANIFPMNTPVNDPRKPGVPNIDVTDSIVTVQVGHPPVAFNVHRGTLLRSPKFLQTKAKPEWSKGEAVVELPHHPSTAFDLYSKWLYSDCIIIRKPLLGFHTPPTGASEDNEWSLLAHAFVLGEALIDTNFKNTIMDALRAKAHAGGGCTIWPVGSSAVHIIYDGTPQASQARKFIVDIYLNHSDPTALDSKDGFPGDFLLDLARTSLSRRTKTPMAFPEAQYTAKCLYHDHGEEGTTCCPAGGLFARLLSSYDIQGRRNLHR